MKTLLRLCAAAPIVASTIAPAFATEPAIPTTTSTIASQVADRGNARPVAQEYPTAGIGDGVTAGGYNQSRWAEDWTRFRDPKKRDDILDQLKYIPIAGDDVYLTLSGEFRARVNLTTNPNLRDREAQRQDIFRVVGGADLHLGEHVRLYGELAHAACRDAIWG